MANSGNNNSSPYYRRYNPYGAGPGPGTWTGSLPPASELLSPSMSYTAKVGPRHAIHSVASPSTAPTSPYMGTPNAYQALTEPGTPGFLNSVIDPVPSPSYESISSPASNHVLSKPSTPLAECRGSPNGVYAPSSHYPTQHFYQVPSPSYESISLPPANHVVQSPKPPGSPNGVYNPPAAHYTAQHFYQVNQQPTCQSMDIVIRASTSGGTGGGDLSHLLMPPPKLAQAPSVVAAAKAAGTVVVSQAPPIQQPTYPSLPPTTSTATSMVVVSPRPPPKRQRAPASQRAQQQRARQLKQQEAERARLMEDREFLTKSVHLRKTVRALVFKNGALSDEVARLKMQIDICKEETKLVAKRVQHHERNRIRRAQTHERKAAIRAAAQTANVDGAESSGIGTPSTPKRAKLS